MNEMTQQETYSMIKTMEELSKNAHRFESTGNKVVPADDIDKALEILRRVASGELAEVKHAHITGRGYDLHCSNCGVSTDIGKNYCHYCGAVFDGKDDSHA